MKATIGGLLAAAFLITVPTVGMAHGTKGVMENFQDRDGAGNYPANGGHAAVSSNPTTKDNGAHAGTPDQADPKGLEGE